MCTLGLVRGQTDTEWVERKRKIFSGLVHTAQAQTDRILEEQENLISRVCDEGTDSEDGDIVNISARNKAVAGVIEAYARAKLDKQKNSVMTLISMTEDSVTRGNTSKLQAIAADYDLDTSYHNKDKLLNYLQLLN